MTRRLLPAGNRFAAIVLLGRAEEPDLYLVPSTEWLNASPPLTDRDNVGKQSARTSLANPFHRVSSASIGGLAHRACAGCL